MKRILKRRQFLEATVKGVGLGIAGSAGIKVRAGTPPAKEIRIGVVGLSVHSAAFSQILNAPDKKSDLDGCRIVALYHPKGNPDVDFTKEQLDKFEADVRQAGVKLTNSMQEMLDLSDAVMIETNDGRPHLREVLPAMKAGKPVFVDKPVAENLAAVVRLYEQAHRYKVPIFTSSALRYVDNMAAIDKSEVVSAFTYSPAALEKSHTDLYWYGIHAVEPLFTLMGPGCTHVMQVQHTDKEDVVVGYWDNGRTGIVRGIRSGKSGFGGTVFTGGGIVPLATFTGYRSLVTNIAAFFRTGISPVPKAETLAIYAFMEAAMESRKRGGAKVSLSETLKKAYSQL